LTELVENISFYVSHAHTHTRTHAHTHTRTHTHTHIHTYTHMHIYIHTVWIYNVISLSYKNFKNFKKVVLAYFGNCVNNMVKEMTEHSSWNIGFIWLLTYKKSRWQEVKLW